MSFTREADFEAALIRILSQKGWEDKVIKNPAEQDLLDNWAQILYDNNGGIDQLNDCPLTDGEMQQIIEQITELRTPLKLNGFINGKSVSIRRDNPDDTLHMGKEISLKIYDRHEIAAGQSRYQIVQQPRYQSKSRMLHDRRGDLMLLINGMPVIHIELKKSGVAVSQAYHQIEKYSGEGLFTGLFSLIQIFVAMEPAETVYFANPGVDGQFNKDFYFHWADFDNEPINDWKAVASSLLSIPMAHQLIGFYTVADTTDGVLKVMRSYQFYAANAISDKVAKTDWKSNDLLGGYIWHTTGSGKTMTSFKSAQLIANSKDADKVIFLMDRIELGTQSLLQYQGFAEAGDDVQETENTGVLVTKMKSDAPENTLIVTSIQKMSNVTSEEEGYNARDLEIMNAKRIVFIIDEAHRSTFGDMLIDIKAAFPSAIYFGFTGTPIHSENQKKMNTTSTVFGPELHRYSIADGIRDKNVLGFDPYKVLTYKDRDIRRAVALERAKAADEEEALANDNKKEIFNVYMRDINMAGHMEADGSYIKGIEDYLSSVQYRTEGHREKVVEDILDNWFTLSQGGKFHAIFATSSIQEAIAYYRMIKSIKPTLKITALFDPNIDNNGDVGYKQDGLIEILEDYNYRYGQDFSLVTHANFKKDVSNRLAHKELYIRVERTPAKQIDLLIVVDQMLTGFDSKWLNTLYVDKLLKYESIIQAFSRTNRLFGKDKPFGTIRYYRFPHSMERNINDAVKLYSGDKPTGVFVELLEYNLNRMNSLFGSISHLFQIAKVQNFEKLPEDHSERGQFAKLFNELNKYLEAVKIQGFKWGQLRYEFRHGQGRKTTTVDLQFDQNAYLILALRYKELFSGSGGGGGGIVDVPYEIVGYLTEIDTGRIDADYMNSRFEKYRKSMTSQDMSSEQVQQILDELHKSFASLSKEDQKYANVLLHDIQSGNVTIEGDMTFKECIADYQSKTKNARITKISQLLGLDEAKLRDMLDLGLTKSSINDYGYFDKLKDTVDMNKAKAYFEKKEGVSIPTFKANIKVHSLLEEFIIKGEIEI